MLQIFILFVVGFFIYQNAILARRKGSSFILWALASVAAYFIVGMIGGGIVLFMKYKGPNGDVEQVNKFLLEQVADPKFSFLLVALGIGGCLLVRLILEKKPSIDSKK